jgi:hypothetical protein
VQIVKENEKVKRCIEEQDSKREEFSEDFNIYADPV